MKRAYIVVVFCLFVSIIISGCATSSIRLLKTNPPHDTLQVKKPFTIKYMLGKFLLPSGPYKAMYEDDDGYYFKAPEKIEATGPFGSNIYDGGLYIKRNANNPTAFYLENIHSQYTTFEVEIDPDVIQK